MMHLLGLRNLPWSLLHSLDLHLVCVHVAGVEKVVMLNKELLSADTNETKNSLTLKLKVQNLLSA